MLPHRVAERPDEVSDAFVVNREHGHARLHPHSRAPPRLAIRLQDLFNPELGELVRVDPLRRLHSPRAVLSFHLPFQPPYTFHSSLISSRARCARLRAGVADAA